VLTRANLAAIDTGTGASIELRRDESPAAVAAADMPVNAAPAQVGAQSTAANAATAALQQMNQAAQPPVQGRTGSQFGAQPGVPGAAFTAAGSVPTALPAPDAANSGFAAPVALGISPLNSSQTLGSTFQVAVTLQNGQDIFSVPMQLQFDPHVLQLVNVDAGTLLQKDGKPETVVHRDDGNGMVTIGATRPPQAPGVSGTGSICTLTFRAAAVGDSAISFVKVGAKNSAQVALAASGANAQVHVK
jgi:general secretion pathway protein D